MTDGALPEAEPTTGPAARSKSRKRGCLRGCLIVFLVFFAFPAALLVGAWFFRNWQMQQALDAEIAAARERGEAISLADLVAARPTSPEIERTTDRWNEVLRQLDEDGVFQYASGRLDDLDRIRKGVEPFGNYGSDRCPFEPPAGEAMSDEERYERTADALLDHFRPTIDLAHEARRSGREVALDYGKSSFIHHFSLPHFKLASEPRELLALETQRALIHADRDRTREALLTSIAVIELLESDPSGSQILVCPVSFGVWIENSLVPAIASGILTGDDLAELQSALQQEPIGERVITCGALWRLSALESLALHARLRTSPIPGHEPPPRPEAFAVDDEWKAYEVSRRYREAATDYAAAVDVAHRLEDDFSESVIDQIRFYHSYAALLQLRVMVASVADLEAHRRVAEVATASERYRLVNGTWPKDLDALIPTFLERLPTDPFDNQPLRYAVDGDSMTVYSIGMNRTDDGGAVGGPIMERDTAIRLPPEPKVEPVAPTEAEESGEFASPDFGSAEDLDVPAESKQSSDE